MSSGLDNLIRVSSKETVPAVDLLTQTFWNDSISCLFFPNESMRKEFLTAYFEYRLKQGILYGEIYATSLDFEGIAFWKPSDKLQNTLWRNIRSGGFSLFRKLGAPLIRNMMIVDKFTTGRRNDFASGPYMYLGPLGVHPNHQGKGYASKLIRPMLQHLDVTSTSCYLETQSESNVSLYEHFGFEILDETVIPGTDIPHWDMMRVARI